MSPVMMGVAGRGFWGLILLAVLGGGVADDVMETMQKRAGKFAALLESTPGLHKAYLDSFVTVFAPHDAAFDKFEGVWDESVILNHMVGSAVSREEVKTEERLTSLMQGHPPIWVRMVRNVLYVNHAQVKFIGRCHSKEGDKKQFLYLIDSVLEPLVPLDDSMENFVDIKAGDLLTKRDLYNLEDLNISMYAQRLEQLGMDNFPELANYGKSTFFIPVDSAFQNLRVGIVDKEVVRAHTVPGHLLFTRPERRRPEARKTVQYDDTTRHSLELKVMAKVFHNNGEDLVESQTLVGTKQHGRGKVKGTILRGNIPVQNGIVHLINKPLVVMASTLWEIIDPSIPDNMRFKTFAEYLSQSPDMVSRLNNARQGTLFIPTNEAFSLLGQDKLENMDLEQVLGLHYLDQTIQTDDVRILQPQDPDTGMFSLATGSLPSSPGKLWMWEEEGTLYVDGGGVRAEVVEENVGASNGVIHSINRVLGLPTASVLDKLSTDPMTRKTFDLGNQEHFNSALSNLDMKFTYFVPSDQAWETVRRDIASAYKVLFMGEFFYQSQHILERHLKVGAKLSLKQLADISVEKGGVEFMRGSPLKVVTEEVEGELVTMVQYDDIMARVVRGDLECSNGYIHLIDRVIMKERDVTLGKSSSLLPSLISLLSTWIVSSLLH